DGIPPAPRGIPQIEVTFDIDANGILNVTAADKATGRSQHITITASSGLSDQEVERMRQESEKNAEADRRKKELVETRNHADNLVYTAEKTLRDYADKIPADVKEEVEKKAARVREVMSTDNIEQIRQATDELGQVIQKVGSTMYQQPGAGPQGGDGSAPGGQTGQGGPDEDVVEGEFKNL
ncbi:MAG TPA: Hsp70 family protein, partial [Anaerolineaceae bacterium]|nr:Hsp70 family protein [Anaerolineaceae bacterium]